MQPVNNTIRELKSLIILKRKEIDEFRKDIHKLTGKIDAVLAEYITSTNQVLYPRQIDFVSMRFGLGKYTRKHSLKEIGEKQNVSIDRVHMILRRAMANVEAFLLKTDD